MTVRTKTFLVGRNKLFCEALKGVLYGSQFEVVGVAEDVGRIEAKIKEGQAPRIILLDAATAPEHAPKDLTHLRSVVAAARIVVLSETLSFQTLAACLDAGAHGYLIKDISVDALLQSLLLVMSGEKVFPSQLSALLVKSIALAPHTGAGAHDLSEREVRILRCLIRGDSNRMIAEHLDLAEAMVKAYMRSLLRKIEVSNRTQAAIWARENLTLLS